MCVALAALDAVVRVQGPKGERTIPIADFHRLPGNTPNVDTNLQPNELITAVDLPAMPFATRSHYLKVRDRASYAFALVSVAAALGTREWDDQIGADRARRRRPQTVARGKGRTGAGRKKPERKTFRAAARRRTCRRQGLQIQLLQDRAGEARHRRASASQHDVMTEFGPLNGDAGSPRNFKRDCHSAMVSRQNDAFTFY